MSEPLRLVVFDVDGTLVDSRAHILMAMQDAFEGAGLSVPSRDSIMHGVGLSLPELMAQLVPDQSASVHHDLAEGYKSASLMRHISAGEDAAAVFYPGIRAVLDRLKIDVFTLMATATGMSRRGLDRIIAQHQLDGYFQSTQVADTHPSKPNPSMLLAALRDTGVAPENAVMIGDTSYDMLMGKSVGTHTIGVTWGNQSPDHLKQADVLVHDSEHLMSTLTTWMENLS
ncbi:HAD-IA family hydrolase [Marivita sp.]|uniref:HAD-IA family hydrolase n=1 Tax=Marivita sp. TaxID=2003365 RepID=UPI003F6B2AC9